MKAKRYHALNVNTKQLGEEAFRHIKNQSMKAKGYHAHNVNTKQLGKETFEDT